MDDQRIDTRIYGATPFTPRPELDGPQASTYTPPVAVPAETALKDSALIPQGIAQIQQDNRQPASILDSMFAGSSQWSVFHVYDSLTAPSFEPMEGYNSNAMLKAANIQTPLDKTQEAFLLNTKSPAEFMFKQTHMDAQQEAYRLMGDHSAASFIAGMVDPGYLAIDAVSMGAGRLAKLAEIGRMGQRGIAASVATAGAYGLGRAEQQVVPLSDTAVFANAMLNGAATGMFYRGGKIEPHDPNFPSQALHELAQDVARPVVRRAEEAAVQAEEVAIRAPREVPVAPVPGGAVQSGQAILRTLESSADRDVSTLATRLGGMVQHDVEVRTMDKLPEGRASYNPEGRVVHIGVNSSDAVKLHELAHAATESKITYGLANPGSAHGQITQELQQIMQQARKAGDFQPGTTSHYLTSDVHEFVAGLFSGRSEFADTLSKLKPDGTKQSLLGRAVDGVRRLLGVPSQQGNALTKAMGLSEALAKHVDAGAPSSVKFAPSPTLAQTQKTVAQAVAKNISWSLHKSLAGFGEVGSKVADLLVDNPLVRHTDSVVNQQRAIRADYSAAQKVFDDLLNNQLAAQGFGTFNQIMKPRQGIAAQRAIEREVGMELLRREALIADGMPVSNAGVPEHVVALADARGEINRLTLAEEKRSGVIGADAIKDNPGYFQRRWDISKIEAVTGAFERAGSTKAEATGRVTDAMSISIQRANGWDAEVSQDIAKAIYDRARRKGYFEDTAFQRSNAATGTEELRDILTQGGVVGERAQRVLDILTGKADEAGKAPVLKHRMRMAMDESIPMPDGSTSTLADMLDMALQSSNERHMDGSAARAAFARKGLPNLSDVQDLRKGLLESIPDTAKRAQAAELFDNTVASIRGEPVGEKMNQFMRNSAAVTQMVGLSSSGLWQFTEYATMMGEHGMLRTVGEMFKELPFVRTLVDSPAEATHLRNVLERNSSQDIRMRPYVSRLEDNFEIPISDTVQLALQQAKQLVPYINGMKYIQTHQARVGANLVIHTFERAANGDAKAIKALEQYGLEQHYLAKVQADIAQHGMDTAKWSDGTWETIRAPMTKMMDDSVLRNRTGEIPAFAQFSALGKFIFTFRSFVLGAHNKVLAGTLNQKGFGGLGLLMMYQFPLTYMTTAANNSINNRKRSEVQTVGDAMGNMGSLGLFSELAGVALGTKQNFGSPGTIAIDRAYKLAGAATSGNAAATGKAALNATPLLSIILPLKAIAENIKETKKEK